MTLEAQASRAMRDAVAEAIAKGRDNADSNAQIADAVLDCMARGDDWPLEATICARDVLVLLGLDGGDSLEPGYRRRDRVARIIGAFLDAAIARAASARENALKAAAAEADKRKAMHDQNYRIARAAGANEIAGADLTRLCEAGAIAERIRALTGADANAASASATPEARG